MKTVVRESRKRLMTDEEYEAMNNNSEGVCTACGETAYNIEPDARGYKCFSCGAREVYGIEELLYMGLIEIDNDSDNLTEASSLERQSV